MNGYEKRTERKKADILLAAQTLFADSGISDVKVSEIAKQAGVSQVTIYNYYGDKLGLVREVLQKYLDETFTVYESILKEGTPFVQKMEKIMAKKEAVIYANQGGFSERAWHDPALMEVFKEVVAERTGEIYKSFIQLGKEEGAIDPTIPDEAILKYLSMSLQIMQEEEHIKASEAYKFGVMKLFLYGLVGKGGEGT